MDQVVGRLAQLSSQIAVSVAQQRAATAEISKSAQTVADSAAHGVAAAAKLSQTATEAGREAEAALAMAIAAAVEIKALDADIAYFLAEL